MSATERLDASYRELGVDRGGATVAPLFMSQVSDPADFTYSSPAAGEALEAYKSLAALAPHGEADSWLQWRAHENGLSLIERITGPDGTIAWYFGSPAGSSCMAISREDLVRGRDKAGVLAIVAVRFRDMLADSRGATVAPLVTICEGIQKAAAGAVRDKRIRSFAARFVDAAPEFNGGKMVAVINHMETCDLCRETMRLAASEDRP